jgi:hypothetical protein
LFHIRLILEFREGKRLENEGGAGLLACVWKRLLPPTPPTHKNTEVLPEIHSKMRKLPRLLYQAAQSKEDA